MCHRFGVRRSCETWVGNVKVLWRLFGSCWLSWDAFWAHFASLGTLLGVILGLSGRLGAPFGTPLGLVLGPSGRLGTPSWLKLTQDGEKTRFFEFEYGLWVPDWDPKINKNR